MRRGRRMLVAGAGWVVLVAGVMFATAAGWKAERAWRLIDRERAIFVRVGAVGVEDRRDGSISWGIPHTPSSSAVTSVPIWGFGAARPPSFCWWFNRGDTSWPLVETFAAPLWVMAVPGVFVAFVGWLRLRMRAQGHCAACGYDLRGSVLSVCPECGSAVAR